MSKSHKNSDTSSDFWLLGLLAIMFLVGLAIIHRSYVSLITVEAFDELKENMTMNGWKPLNNKEYFLSFSKEQPNGQHAFFQLERNGNLAGWTATLSGNGNHTTHTIPITSARNIPNCVVFDTFNETPPVAYTGPLSKMRAGDWGWVSVLNFSSEKVAKLAFQTNGECYLEGDIRVKSQPETNLDICVICAGQDDPIRRQNLTHYQRLVWQKNLQTNHQEFAAVLLVGQPVNPAILLNRLDVAEPTPATAKSK